MKKTNKIILITLVVFILLLGIGYAAIQNITLNISGTAAAAPNQANFNVRFIGTPTVSDNVYATAEVTGDTTATINVSGLSSAGESVSAVYTIKNESSDLSADLLVSTTNDNPEYFSISSKVEKTSLIAGESTSVIVSVELTKTPIVDSVSATIGMQLESIPVQPGEEGASGITNDFSETPDEEKNELGFYYDKLYINIENESGFVLHEDGSAEKLMYIQPEKYDNIMYNNNNNTNALWFYSKEWNPGTFDFEKICEEGCEVFDDDLDIIVENVEILNGGRTLDLDGVKYTISNLDVHGIYYGNEYSIVIEDDTEVRAIIQEDGHVNISIYNGNGEYYYDYTNFYMSNTVKGYFNKDDEYILSIDATGEKLGIKAKNIPPIIYTLKEKHNYSTEIIKDVTCGEDGEGKKTCLDCGNSYTYTLKSTNHKNDVNYDGICDECGEQIVYEETYIDAQNREEYGYSEDITDFTIKATYYDEITRTWYKVTEIDNSAFENCKNLTSVVITEGVERIEGDAFRLCTNLTNIVLPESLSAINSYAFRFCESLTQIYIPKNVKEILGSSFSGCDSLERIDVASDNPNYCEKDGILYTKDMTKLVRYPSAKSGTIYSIPDTVNEIDDGAFEECLNLTNVIIPDTVTSLGSYAFMYSSNITEIVIPGSITEFDYEVFGYCKGLTKVVFLDGVDSIGRYMFYQCSNLTEVVIPSSVTKIEYATFNYCQKLTTVNYTGTKEQWEAIEIGTLNEYLTNATINYNYVMPVE